MANLDLTLKPGDDVKTHTGTVGNASGPGVDRKPRGPLPNDPPRDLGELAALTGAEYWQLLMDWNQTATDYPKDQCVHELVAAQAERAPEAIAAVFKDASLTYRQLNDRANQLAHHLQSLGVGPDTLVAICMERSLDMLVGLLGILKAGGAYVPLDPAYPRERLAFMVRDSGAPVLLTLERLRDQLQLDPSACRILCLDADGGVIAACPTQNPASRVKPDHLAYMIYTSGTTGEPKGVELMHIGVLNLIFWHRDAYQVRPDDKATHLAGVGFDASVWELWPYLTAGASLHLPDDETRLVPEKLRDWLVGQAITFTFVPTPLAEKLVAQPWPEKVALRAMLTGGDRLNCRVSPGLPFPLINHYGPTENTVVTTCAVVEVGGDGHAPPIGRPIANTRVYLLDDALRPVPIGSTGEICIGGDGLARGYHRRPELTAEKFVADPFSGKPGDRLYKTGDLARYLPTGAIEFVGRNDDQVKIRGNRVELGEIESVLGRHPGVWAAVVKAVEDGAGGTRLAAYITIHPPIPTRDNLREYLRKQLPEYMVPAVFIMMDEFPVTPNGKVDRAALPDPASADGAGSPGEADPLTEVQHTVANIVAALLGLDQVEAQANFFDLGGHSLLATQLIARVRDEFGVDLPLLKVFESPTISDLSAEIEDMVVAELATVHDRENREERERHSALNSEGATGLIGIQVKGNCPPLFFLHGDWAGSGAYCLRISQQLGENQPFFALPPYRSEKQNVFSMEEMARYHTTAIQKHTPHGPYLIGGYCVGATVVMEMARQLIEQGEEVTRIFLIAPPPSSNPLLRGIWPVVDGVGNFLKWDLRTKIYYFDRYGVAFDRWLGKSPGSKLMALGRRLGFVIKIGSRPPAERDEDDGDGDNEILKSLDYAVYVLAYRLYNLKPLTVPATLYFPKEKPPPSLSSSLAQANHGDIFPSSIVSIEMVPGNRRTCVTKYASTLVSRMRETLGQSTPATEAMGGEKIHRTLDGPATAPIDGLPQ